MLVGMLCKTLRFLQKRSLSVPPEFAKKKNVRKFIDSLRIYVKGGAGGQGVHKYGGFGGRGGHVIVVADEKASLEKLKNEHPKKRFTASRGADSHRRRLLGDDGEDLEVKVPLGIALKTDDGRVLGDLNEHGQSVMVAKGGEGGNAHNNFMGMKGQAFSLTLDLKLIADIGLVGFPNAGKSTFLKAISRSTPKIAGYPFTTIRPQIGTMEYRDFRQITVADLPGLIEGAHVNFGMGHKFLKHVERTKMLLFMVDVGGFQLGNDYEHRSAFQTILLLNKELELFNPSMLDKPAALALNKSDMDPAGEEFEKVAELVKALPDSLSELDPHFHPKRLVKFDKIFRISAKYYEETEELKLALRGMLDHYADIEEAESRTFQGDKKISYPENVLGKEQSKRKLV